MVYCFVFQSINQSIINQSSNQFIFIAINLSITYVHFGEDWPYINHELVIGYEISISQNSARFIPFYVHFFSTVLSISNTVSFWRIRNCLPFANNWSHPAIAYNTCWHCRWTFISKQPFSNFPSRTTGLFFLWLMYNVACVLELSFLDYPIQIFLAFKYIQWVCL